MAPWSVLIYDEAMDLVIFGIQGSGKGTQAQRLALEGGYDIFEAGGELRKIAALATEPVDAASRALGRTVKSYIDVGKLVPHAIIIEVVERAIRSRVPTQKILFDGIPRDLDQMQDFTEIMRKIGREFRCIHIALDPEEGVQRILRRAQTEGRADDAHEETIRKRMRIFTEKTLPVIERFRTEGKVIEIDGHGSVEDIYRRIHEALAPG